MEMTTAAVSSLLPGEADRSRSPLTIYWDGRCPMCAAIKSRFAPFDRDHRLEFVDLNDAIVAATASPRFTPTELVGAMRVKMPDGTWRSGYFAWAAILEALQSWSLIGALMRLWIFADIGPKAYAWVASHRYGISRVLGLPRPCAPDDACRIH